MAAVIVTVLNNSNQTVSLGLDDERDAEQIEYLKTLERREDLADVDVKPVTAKRGAAKPTDDVKPVTAKRGAAKPSTDAGDDANPKPIADASDAS